MDTNIEVGDRRHRDTGVEVKWGNCSHRFWGGARRDAAIKQIGR